MKKTFTVNLGGTVFQIDEDAYILLDNYLNNLRFHFRKEEGGDEIVRDMEMRISELFTEGMEGGQQVITIDNVETVIARMGRPEQLDESQHETVDADNDSTAGTSDGTFHAETKRGTEAATETVKKRLFRDVDNRVLGGVLSGIAAYMGWDPTALRLAYILLGILTKGVSFLLLYLILQFIIPPARTATEKLQMRGEPINMENIGKTVTGGYARENQNDIEGKSRTGLQKFFDVIVTVFGILVKIFLVILVICCIPILLFGVLILLSLILSVFGIFVHLPSICCSLMPHFPWNQLSSYPSGGIFFLLSILLFVGIPLMALFQVILQHFGYSKPLSPATKVGMILLWFIAMIAGFILFFTLSTLP